MADGNTPIVIVCDFPSFTVVISKLHGVHNVLVYRNVFPMWSTINVFLLENFDGDVYYSQTFIKRSPLGQIKCFFLREVTPWKMFISYNIFYDGTRKRWPLHTSGCLIEVTVWAGMTVLCFIINLRGIFYFWLAFWWFKVNRNNILQTVYAMIYVI